MSDFFLLIWSCYVGINRKPQNHQKSWRSIVPTTKPFSWVSRILMGGVDNEWQRQRQRHLVFYVVFFLMSCCVFNIPRNPIKPHMYMKVFSRPVHLYQWFLIIITIKENISAIIQTRRRGGWHALSIQMDSAYEKYGTLLINIYI